MAEQMEEMTMKGGMYLVMSIGVRSTIVFNPLLLYLPKFLLRFLYYDDTIPLPSCNPLIEVVSHTISRKPL